MLYTFIIEQADVKGRFRGGILLAEYSPNMFKPLRKTGYGSAHLEPSHSGGGSRRMATSRSLFSCSKCLANLSYMRPCLRHTKTNNKTQFLSIPMQSRQRNLHYQILFNVQMCSVLLHSVCFNRGLQNLTHFK